MRDPSLDRPRRRAPLIVPASLILAGIYLLAANLDLGLPNILPLLLRFWPLMLIVVGLELLSPWRRGAGLLLGLVLAGGLLGGLYATGRVQLDTQPGRKVILAPLQGAVRAEVVLDIGASDLRLGPLAAGRDSLAEGSFESRYLTLDQHVSRSGDAVTLELDTAGSSFLLPDGASTLQLDLSRAIPLALTVDAGATQLHLDLAELRVEQLTVDAGASDGTIILPSSGPGRVSIDAGASSLVLVIPPGTAARIRVDSSASSVKVESPRITRQGDLYLTSGDGSEVALEVEIDAGAASIILR